MEYSEGIQTFLENAKNVLPFHYYEPIERSYIEKDHAFKSVMITHLYNSFKKKILDSKQFEDLVKLMDYFTDPYEELHQRISRVRWSDIKDRLIGGA